VVLALISLLAAIAAPSLLHLSRDIAISRAAIEIVEIYRSALALSLERTILVSFHKAPHISFDIREASLDDENTTPSLERSRSCNAIAWSDPTRLSIRSLDVRAADAPAFFDVRFLAPLSLEKSRADLCFDRRRVFVRYDDGTFVELTAPANVEVKNTVSGALRIVSIPSSGSARVSR